MLDQADFIARYDKTDMLGAIGRMGEQLRNEFTVEGLEELERPENVVLAAIGGSALPGEFVKTWLGQRLEVPLVIVRDYALPAFVGPKTLVIASSYSGSTEETLSVMSEAQKRGAKVVVMTAGGKLLELAEAGGYPAVVLPADFNPRLSVFYGVRALATVLEGIGLVKGAVSDLIEVSEWLGKQNLEQWDPVTPTSGNEAKQMASDLVGHPVVVYSGPALAYAAMKWKIAINENAKNIAFYNYFSELNHNEFTGWLKPERTGIKVIELQTELDHPRVQKRFEVTNKLISNVWAPIEVKAVGKSTLEQQVWCTVLADYMSVYLGVLNQVDVAALEMVDELKKRLG